MVIREIYESDVRLSCSCEIYKVLGVTVYVDFGSSDWNGVNCCHCRILTEIYENVSWQGYSIN